MNLTSRTVLIIDDSPEDCELYRRYLGHDRNYTYTILAAELGQQGLDLWRQYQPDAILLDYQLPDLDGLGVLNQLQIVTQQSCLPVIVVTGQGNEAIAVETMKAGAQDYLVKGQINSEQLQKAINSAIETAQLRNQLQQCIARERLVARITQKLHQSLDLAEILQTTVDEVRHFLQTDRVLIFRLQSDGQGTIVTESVGAEWISFLSQSFHDPCLQESYLDSFRQGRVTIKSDIYDGSIDPCHVELLENLQVRANLVVPILQNDQLWGMLIVHHCTDARLWKGTEVELLKEVATQSGIALQQAELHQYLKTELAERKQVEQQLRDSEARFRALVSSSSNVIYRVSADWRELRELQGNTTLIAASPMQPTRDWLQKYIPLDDQATVMAAVQTAIQTKSLFELEHRVQKIDGSLGWIYSRAVPLLNPAGEIVEWFGELMDITARKQAENDLAIYKAKLQCFVDSNIVGIAMADLSGNLHEANDAFLDMLGYTRLELESGVLRWRDMTPPDWAEVDNQAIVQIRETGSCPPFEKEYLHKDGSRVPILIGVAMLPDSEENCFCFVLDLSDRKQAEAALATNEARLRGFVDSNVVGILYGDVYGNIHEANDALLEMIGYSREELQAGVISWINITPPEFLSLDDQAIAQAQATGACTPHEKEYIRKDGTRVPVLVGYSLVGEAREESVAFILDLTERKRTEEALQQSEAFKDRMLASSPDCIKVLDMEGRLLYINAGGLCVMEIDDFTPYCNAEWVSFWEGEEQQQALQALATAKKGGTSTFEGYCPTAKGTPKWWEVIVSPILDGSGQVERVLSISRDITERKQAEQEREHLLAQEQAAREEAERANRVKDEFLAILSHELRSPLNPILGWTKLMQSREFEPEETSAALATIERSVKVQIQLIDDLLDIAKILRGKLTMKTEPVNLVTAVESAIETVQSAVQAKSIQLHEVLPQVGLVMGDTTRLQQIVWNLLSNAIKFTPDQGRVEIRLEQVGNWAQIMVSDTGKGIKPDFLPHLFESFCQEDASTTRRFGGLGLGLAIVRSLVEAHGGTIWAESPGEGQGATFTVQLPLLTTLSAAEQTEVLSAQDLDLTGVRILTVDDDLDVREVLTAILTQAGAEVLTVASAAEVLTALNSFQPDVLVSDIGMPELDGYTLIRHIQALFARRGKYLPAIALTAYARQEDAQRALQEGFQQHLSKPIEPARLIQAIAWCIRQSEVFEK
jgi:PAS domain S-box-containing protein